FMKTGKPVGYLDIKTHVANALDELFDAMTHCPSINKLRIRNSALLAKVLLSLSLVINRVKCSELHIEDANHPHTKEAVVEALSQLLFAARFTGNTFTVWI